MRIPGPVGEFQARRATRHREEREEEQEQEERRRDDVRDGEIDLRLRTKFRPRKIKRVQSRVDAARLVRRRPPIQKRRR